MKPGAIDWLIAAAFGLLISWLAADGLTHQIDTETNLPRPYVVTANQ